MGDGHHSDQCGEHEPCLPVTQVETFCCEVTSCSTQGEGEQDGQPVKRFPFGRVDGVNGQCLLTRVPSRKGRQQREGEDDGGRLQTDPKVVHKVIAYQRADNANHHHREPVDPWHVLPRPELEEQRDEQEAAHDNRRVGQAPVQVYVQEVCGRLAHRGCHDLDDPKEDRDFRNLVQHLPASWLGGRDFFRYGWF